MFFRNLSLYRFADGAVTHEALADALAVDGVALREIGPLELACSGFINCGLADSLLVTLGDFGLVRLAVTEKVLPAAVINEELAKRIAAIKQNDSRPVRGKERKRIKDEILTDFMARAFSRTRASSAYFDFKNGWLVIDTASRKVAEFVITKLREALGSFPCTPCTPEESPKVLMTDWLARSAPPAQILLGDECTLKEPAEAGAAWSGKRTDLESDDVLEHLKSGMQVERLGLTFADRISFTLCDDLTVRKLKFLDVVADDVDGEDAAAIALSTFTLMTLELQRLLDVLTLVFAIPRAAALRLDGGATAPEMREPAMTDEKAIRVTATLYRARDAAKSLLGDDYVGRMATMGAQIRQKAKDNGLTELALVTKVAKDAEQPILWLAAYVELVEPSAPAEPIRNTKTDKVAREAVSALKKAGLNVHSSFRVGTDLTERLNNLTDLTDAERAWLTNGERGMSSETMFAALHGVPDVTDHFHPLDPVDFRRCRLLLEAVPDYAHRLGELSHLSPVWERLVTAWPDLCSTMDAECPAWRDGVGNCKETYEAMQFFIGKHS